MKGALLITRKNAKYDKTFSQKKKLITPYFISTVNDLALASLKSLVVVDSFEYG